MKILTIVKDNVTYRFTDVIKVGNHYLAHQIRDDNSIGKMEHRITRKDYDNSTITESIDTK